MTKVQFGTSRRPEPWLAAALQFLPLVVPLLWGLGYLYLGYPRRFAVAMLGGVLGWVFAVFVMAQLYSDSVSGGDLIGSFHQIFAIFAIFVVISMLAMLGMAIDAWQLAQAQPLP